MEKSLHDLIFYDQCEIQKDKHVAVAVYEITEVANIDNPSDVLNEYMEISSDFFSLLNEFYTFFETFNTSFELLLVSEEALGQTFSANIRIYIVIRTILFSAEKAGIILAHQEKLLTQVLMSNHYTFVRVSNSNPSFLNVRRKLESLNQYVITKEDRVIYARCPITDYYYYVDIIPQSRQKQYNKILEALRNYPDTAVSFQLMPTQFTPNEVDSIERATAVLDKIFNGFPDDYYGEIRDNLSEIPFETYTYYFKNIGKPLFSYNILIFSKPSSSLALISQVERHLNDGDEPGRVANFVKQDISELPLHYNKDFFTFPWSIHDELLHYHRKTDFWEAQNSPKSLMRLPFILTSEEAVTFFKLPAAEEGRLAGMEVNKLNNKSETFDPGVIDKNNLQFGTILGSNIDVSIGIGLNDLSKHMFVTGVPGSGKTTFCKNILLQLHKNGIPFLVIEPVKTEYKALVDIVPFLQIIEPGSGRAPELVLNPFIPPKDVTLKTYKPSLVNAFSAAFAMAAPLDQLFLESVNECYGEHGWRDFTTSDDDYAIHFGLMEFVKTFRRIVESKTYSGEVKGNIESAGTLRLMSLINQDYTIFDTVTTLSIDDILKRPTVIELDSIDNIEQKSLIIALLLIGIFAYQSAHPRLSPHGMLHHVLLLEEAHVLLNNSNKRIAQNGEAQPNTYAEEFINRILAEKRAMGFGIIIADQSPQKVTIDVIRNTDAKIVFRTVESKDREVIAQCSNMSDVQKAQMSILKTGNAFVFFNRIDKPQLIQTLDFEVNNHIIESSTESSSGCCDSSDTLGMLWPYPECACISACVNGCRLHIRAEARFIVDRIFSKHFRNRKADCDSFLYVTDHSNSIISSLCNPYLDISDAISVNCCTKLQFLRKVYLETDINMELNIRQNFLLSQNYIGGGDSVS